MFQTLKKYLPAFAAALMLTQISACSQGQAGLRPPNLFGPRFQGMNAPSMTSPLVFGDLAVKFNNAYSALYTENEAAGRSDPQNPDKIFTKLINEATKTIDLAIFDLEEPSAAEALIAARKRGVRVRVVTDTDNMGEPGMPQIARAIHRRMRAAGISIKGDKRRPFMHNKFMIIDGEQVVTGSLNLTPYSLYRDNNNSLRINSPQLAANYQAEFERLFTRELFGSNPHQIPYPVVQVDGATIQTYFSPRGGTKQAILETLSKAQKQIRMMAFSVTDEDVQQLLIEKHRQGVSIEAIFDGCMISQYSIFQDLLLKNIPVMIDGNQALLHSKVFVVDGQVVITGSYNFSKNAEERNNENTLIIRSPKVAGFYNEEFERLKRASLTHQVPPYDNRACSSTESGNDTQIQGE
ncbi:MAG: phospholipase D-like domain-containing protein [Candidatus Sericytochromatia bacterium]